MPQQEWLQLDVEISDVATKQATLAVVNFCPNIEIGHVSDLRRIVGKYAPFGFFRWQKPHKNGIQVHRRTHQCILLVSKRLSKCLKAMIDDRPLLEASVDIGGAFGLLLM